MFGALGFGGDEGEDDSRLVGAFDDAIGIGGDGADEAVDRGVAGVGDGGGAAVGRDLALAQDDGVDEALHGLGGEVVVRERFGEELLGDAGDVMRAEAEDDVVRLEEVAELHRRIMSSSR